MRRTPTTRPENQVALALAEIERLKAVVARITDGRHLVIDPGVAVGDSSPVVEAGPHVLYGSKHTRSLRVTAAAGVSLNVDIEQGQVWVNGVFFSVAAGTLLMVDATTNFVFVNSAGALASNTTGFPTSGIPLATVVTAAGDVTAVNDRRAYLNAGAWNSITGILTTRGDLLTRDATQLVRLGIGAAGSILRADGLDPAWTINPTIAGYMRLGATAAPANITAGDLTVDRLFVGNNLMEAEGRLVQVRDTYINSLDEVKQTVDVVSTYRPGANHAGLNAMRTAVLAEPSGAFTGVITAIRGQALHQGGAGVSMVRLSGQEWEVSQNLAATTISTMLGHRIAMRALAGGVSTLVGLDIQRGSAGDLGSIGTSVGLRIQPHLAPTPTSDIAIQSQGGQNIFVGNTKIGADAPPGVALDVAGSGWIGTYLRVGALAAPANVAAGDLTATRVKVGDGAFGAGVDFSVTGDGALSGFLRVGSETAPINAAAGDLTGARLLLGTDVALLADVRLLINSGGSNQFRIANTVAGANQASAFTMSQDTVGDAVIANNFSQGLLSLVAGGGALGQIVLSQDPAFGQALIRMRATTLDAFLVGGRWGTWFRVGSASASPANTAVGDLTATRLFVGDAAAIAGVEARITGDMAITARLSVGTATLATAPIEVRGAMDAVVALGASNMRFGTIGDTSILWESATGAMWDCRSSGSSLRLGRTNTSFDVDFEITGVEIANALRVGALTAPVNATAGDITGIRLAIGDQAFANSAQAHIVQPTIGNDVLQIISTAVNDDPTERVLQGRVATTDATVTTLLTITIPASTTVMIEVDVQARRTGGLGGAAEDGAAYIRRAGVKNVAGVATLIGAVQDGFTVEDQAAWDATITVTGATALVRVTGGADNNITWHCTARVWSVGT